MKGEKIQNMKEAQSSFIISWLDANPTVKTISKLTAHIDITPTLIDLCGLNNPDISFDGISLKELY